MTLLYVYHRAITLFKVHCCQYLFWLFKVALCCFHILHFIMHFLCNQCVFSLHRNCMAGNKIRKAAPAAAAVAYCKIRPERPFFPTSSILPPISPQFPLSSSPSPLSPSFCVLPHYGWFLHNLSRNYKRLLYSNSANFCLFVCLRVGSLLCLMNQIRICRVPRVSNGTGAAIEFMLVLNHWTFH